MIVPVLFATTRSSSTHVLPATSRSDAQVIRPVKTRLGRERSELQ
ncbi:MAG: hypothetical protein ACR2HQ_04625 [Ilumatobacteraceae bacterium]